MDLDLHLPGIAAADADAFAAWMTGAEEPLRRGLRGFARQVDVEAVLQETLLRVWQVAPRFTPDGRPNGLLRMAHRIARNLAISEARRARVTPVAPAVLEAGVDAAARVAPQPPDPMLRQVIALCREKLRGRPAEALTARLESGGGVPDFTLAKRLGMTKNTFLQNVTRARRALGACLRKHGVDLAAELV